MQFLTLNLNYINIKNYFFLENPLSITVGGCHIIFKRKRPDIHVLE